MSHTSSNDGRDELLFSLDRLTMLIYISLSIASGLTGVFIYIYYLRKGQFNDQEEVKYQLFRDEEQE